MTPLDSIRLALVRSRCELDSALVANAARRVPIEYTLKDIETALAAVDMFAACLESPVSSDLEIAGTMTLTTPHATPQPPAPPPANGDNGAGVPVPQPPPRKPPPQTRLHPLYGQPVGGELNVTF